MFRIGIKMGPARNKEWTCMFGMHVRTATIIIGLWHLVNFDEIINDCGRQLYFGSVSATECNGFGSVGSDYSKPGNDSQS